jgi:hypothetical protein
VSRAHPVLISNCNCYLECRLWEPRGLLKDLRFYLISRFTGKNQRYSRKNSEGFWIWFRIQKGFLPLKNDVKVPSKRNKEKKFVFASILNVIEENTRIRIH